jgi:hypothetical protein
MPVQLRAQVTRLARAGRPHPDPDVQRIAVGWIREGTRRLNRLAVLYGLGVLLVTVPAAAVTIQHRVPERWFYGWLVLAAGIGVAIGVGHGGRYGFASTRLRIVSLNLRALLDAQPASQPRPMHAGRSVSDRWLAWYPWAYATLAAVLFGGDLMRTGFRARDGFVAVVSTFLVWTAVRDWDKPRPPLSIGPAGLSLSRWSTLIPWSAISGVALLGPDRKRPRRYAIAFRLADADEVLRRVPKRRRPALRRTIENTMADDAIAVDAAALRVPPEELVSAARGYCATR